MHGRERGGVGDDARAGDSCGALGGEHEDDEDDDLVAQAEMSVGCLGNEDGSHAEVDCSSICVEGISSRHDHAHDGFGAAEVVSILIIKGASTASEDEVPMVMRTSSRMYRRSWNKLKPAMRAMRPRTTTTKRMGDEPEPRR